MRDSAASGEEKHENPSSNAKNKPRQPQNGQNGSHPNKSAQPQDAGGEQSQKQKAKSTTEPLPSNNPFQATKFDKFIAIIGSIDGEPIEGDWISIDRSYCIATCKSQGLDISRRELQSFCEYASNAIRVGSTSILIKKKSLLPSSSKA